MHNYDAHDAQIVPNINYLEEGCYSALMAMVV
jgi:hypothetical protein